MGVVVLNVWTHGKRATLTSDHQPVEVHIKACEKGSARNCIEVGFIYEVGDLAKKDTKKAIEFYNKACSLNFAIRMYQHSYFIYKKSNPELRLIRLNNFLLKGVKASALSLSR